jgi:hypothetical protein
MSSESVQPKTKKTIQDDSESDIEDDLDTEGKL